MRTLILSFIFVLGGISAMAQNKADLKLNLEKNKTYRFSSVSSQNISQTVNGVLQNTTVHSNSFSSIKMMDARPEFMIAEIRFDTLVIRTNAMGVNSVYNSKLEGNLKSTEMSDVMTCILNRLSKNGIYAKMTYAGKVTEIVNAKMLSDIILKDTNTITGQAAPVMKVQIANMVSNEALITMIEAFTGYLPGKQVSSGVKWENLQYTNSGGMSFDVSTTYAVNAISEKGIGIAGESNIKASENAKPLEYGPAKITYGEVTGLSRSNLLVDANTGLLIESSEKSHITGNLGVAVQGMNLQIPMEMESQSEIKALP
jgi:hypothetical protein